MPDFERAETKPTNRISDELMTKLLQDIHHPPGASSWSGDDPISRELQNFGHNLRPALGITSDGQNGPDEKAEPSLWERVSQDLHVKDYLGGNGSDVKIARVTYAAAQGTYEGAANSIESMVNHPTETLRSVAIAGLELGLMFSGAKSRGGSLVRSVPTLLGLTAAMDLGLHSNDIKAGLSEAWNSNADLAGAALKLRSIGTAAVDCGLAKTEMHFANKAVGDLSRYVLGNTWAPRAPFTSRKEAIENIPNGATNHELLSSLKSAGTDVIKRDMP